MGTNRVLGGGGFHHVAMRVGDFDRSYRFYTEGLGFVETFAWDSRGNRAAMLDAGDGNYLELFAGGEPIANPSSPMLHFALRTADCDAAIERARAAGAVVTVEPKDVDIPAQPRPYPVRIAFCQGPDGELIELFQER